MVDVDPKFLDQRSITGGAWGMHVRPQDHFAAEPPPRHLVLPLFEGTIDDEAIERTSANPKKLVPGKGPSASTGH